MNEEVMTTFAALGLLGAPAVLEAVDSRAPTESDEVMCVSRANAPVERRFGGAEDIAARLKTGTEVTVLGSRDDFSRIAYPHENRARVGWIRSSHLAACDGGSEDGEPSTEATGAAHRTGGSSSISKSPHLLFGVPVDADPSDDFLLNHGIYVVSYNRNLNNPNWVSWRLTAADLGDEDRQDDFRADDDLPGDFLHVSDDDYAGSGFDRGHMCPSAQRTATAEANSLTFLMTNMQPQMHSLNAGPWKSLETFERKLANDGNKDLYIVAGGIFAARPQTIGPGIAVPNQNFRVTVVLDAGQGLDDLTPQTPIHAVEMPNDASAKGHKWTEFKVSIDDVEEDTGYDFLRAPPDGLEAQVEAAVSPGP